MFARTKPPVKRYRLVDRPKGHPFAFGLEVLPITPIRPVPRPLPPGPPAPDPMPRKMESGWRGLEMAGLEVPQAVMLVSGAWAMPGEDWSWDFGHSDA